MGVCRSSVMVTCNAIDKNVVKTPVPVPQKMRVFRFPVTDHQVIKSQTTAFIQDKVMFLLTFKT